MAWSPRPVGPRMRRRFAAPRGYWSHNSQIRPAIEEVTEHVQWLAQVIGEAVPEGRQQELALEALEVVQMRVGRAFDIPEPVLQGEHDEPVP